MTTKGVTIDWETADQITAQSLYEHKKALKKHNKIIENGRWDNTSDIDRNKEIIKAINVILKYYGWET